MRLQAEYPMPPSTNHLYFNTKWGGRALSAAGKAYKKTAKLKTMAEWGRKKKLVAPLTMTMTLYSPTWLTKMGRDKGPEVCVENDKRAYHRSDISNRIKVLEDAICDVICHWGDEQVWYLVVKKEVHERERVQVLVEPLGNSYP